MGLHVSTINKKSGYIAIRVNPPEFFGRLLTTIYKKEKITLGIGDQIIQKLNFYISGVKLI